MTFIPCAEVRRSLAEPEFLCSDGHLTVAVRSSRAVFLDADLGLFAKLDECVIAFDERHEFPFRDPDLKAADLTLIRFDKYSNDDPIRRHRRRWRWRTGKANCLD